MMVQSQKQQGSSMLGLLTVSAIFVGLLAYATVAFEKKPAVVASSSPHAETAIDQNSIGPSPAQPAVDKAKNAVSEHSSNQQTAALAIEGEQAVDDLSASIVDNAGLSPASIAVPPVINSERLQQDVVAVAAVAQQQADWANGYAQYGHAMSRGSARGKQAMSRRGEFNFSVKFISRARMEADSEMDGRFQQAYDANQYASQYAGHLQQNGQSMGNRYNSQY